MPQRELLEHQTCYANEYLQIVAVDPPGPKGNSDIYRLSGFDTAAHPSRAALPVMDNLHLVFRSTTYPDGPDGLTGEALLVVVLDRLRGFQTGPGACRENALAITKLEEALDHLARRGRTLGRDYAGVPL